MATFEKFFGMIGAELLPRSSLSARTCGNLTCNVIAKHCPQALNILDRFHIVAKMNLALRRRACRRGPQHGPATATSRC